MADPRANFAANLSALGIDLNAGGDTAYVLPNDGRDDELDQVMCGICEQGLQRHFSPEGVESLIHERSWVEYDHDPDPVEVPPGARKNSLCDFCGAQRQTYWHLKGDRLIQETGNLVRDLGGTWGACEICGQLLHRMDLEALLDRCMENDLHRDLDKEQIRRSRLSALSDWLQYLATVTEMVYVGPRPSPAKMTWQMMPRLQAGLVKYWNSPNLKLGLCQDRRNWIAPLPSFVCGEDEGQPTADDFSRLFLAGVAVPEGAWDKHVKHTSASIWNADLYWVSSQFTQLAIMAGKDFETLVLRREDLPAEAGVLIWQDSVGEIPRSDPDIGGAASIRGASWTVVPDGIWVAFYIQPEDADPNVDVPTVRQQIGWLMSPNTGGGIKFGEVEVEDSRLGVLRTLLATLFLLNQPGVAEVSTAPVDKREARKYQRNHKRPQPQVRLINLRSRPQRAHVSQEGGPRGPIDYRVYRKGHWKMVAYGPKRGMRRPHHVDGYIAGPDGAPLRPIKPEVKVLK